MPDYDGYSISHNDDGSITLHYTPVKPGIYRIAVELEGTLCPGFPVCCTVQKIDDDFMTSYETGSDNLLPVLPKAVEPQAEALGVDHIDVSTIVASLVSNEAAARDTPVEQSGPTISSHENHQSYSELEYRNQERHSSPANNVVPELPAELIADDHGNSDVKAELEAGKVAESCADGGHPIEATAASPVSTAEKQAEVVLEHTPKAGKSAVRIGEVDSWTIMEVDESKNRNAPPVLTAEPTAEVTAEPVPPVVTAEPTTVVTTEPVPPVVTAEPTTVEEEYIAKDEATPRSVSTRAKTRDLRRRSTKNVADKTDSKKVSLLQKNLKKLKPSINDSGKLSCKIICCDTSYDNLDKMQQHIRENHQGADIAPTERTSFTNSEELEVPRRKSGCTSAKKRKFEADEESGQNKKSTGVSVLHAILAETSDNNCPLCEKVLASKQCMKKHIRNMHGKLIGLQESTPPEAVACEVCGKSYFNKYTLQQHVDRMHNKRGAFPCEAEGCSKIFNSPRDLKLHAPIHEGGPNPRSSKPYEVCSLCGKQISWGNLKAHIARKHKAVPGSYACKHPGCLKTFKVLDDLNRHSVIHKERAQYACDFCEKTFLKEPSLRVHMEAVHQSQDQIPCTVKGCPKVFPTKYKLKVHIQAVHRAKAKAHCSFPHCSAVLGDKRSLRKHEMIHEGYRWVCTEPDCQQIFTQKHSLMRHIQDKHSQVVPRFACHHPGCAKTFKFKDLLKAHMRSHVSVRNFHCLECSKSYKTRSLLNAHSRIHDVDRQYKCELCDTAFARRYRLKVHIQKTHPGNTRQLEPQQACEVKTELVQGGNAVLQVKLRNATEMSE